MTGSAEGQRPAPRIVRRREGRVLGGVCAGLPDTLRLGTNGLRLLFVLASLFGGVGVVAYVTCWMVIPAQDQDPDRDPVRSIVLLAWATGALVVLVLIGSIAAAATVFGLGWVVLIVAACVAALTVSPLHTKVPTVAVLLTLAALTLPAMAVALSPLRLTFQSGETVSRPRTFTALSHTVYRSGFGTLFIDLRRTAFSDRNTILRIDAGLRRTIIALPTDRCVRVRVNYDIHLFPAHLAALLSGRYATPFHDVVLFGKPYGYGAWLGTDATAVSTVTTPTGGPRLTVDFTSQGGGLYVRDYPDNIDPTFTPQWPGYPVVVEPRPYLGNEPHKLWKPILRAWHRRLPAERASQEAYDSNADGPCVPGGITPAAATGRSSGPATTTNGTSMTAVTGGGPAAREQPSKPTGGGL